MIYANAHCDTATELVLRPDRGDLLQNTMDFDFRRALTISKQWIQCLAVFVDSSVPRANGTDPELYERYLDYMVDIRRQLSKMGDRVVMVRNRQDLDMALETGRVAAVMTLENGAVLERNMDVLPSLWYDGIRIITLTWNDDNEIGCGASTGPRADAKFGTETRDTGLTHWGRMLLKNMADLRMGVDCSHMSEQTFWDVIEHGSDNILFATHSNCDALCMHPRNLTDKQLQALGDREAFMGISYVPFFLKEEGIPTIDDVYAHIDHALQFLGVNNIGLGSDWDGFSNKYTDFCGVFEHKRVAEYLLKKNYSEKTVNKIIGENFYAHLCRCL